MYDRTYVRTTPSHLSLFFYHDMDICTYAWNCMGCTRTNNPIYSSRLLWTNKFRNHYGVFFNGSYDRYGLRAFSCRNTCRLYWQLYFRIHNFSNTSRYRFCFFPTCHAAKEACEPSLKVVSERIVVSRRADSNQLQQEYQYGRLRWNVIQLLRQK